MIVLGDDGGVGEGKNMMSYQSLVKDSGSRFPCEIKLDPKKDIAILPFSSGTTGHPKGVVMSHYNMSSCVVQLEYGGLHSEYYLNGNILCVTPFFHVSGMLFNMMCGLHAGTRLVISPKFDPKSFIQTISQQKVTFIKLVPPLMLFLANHPTVNDYDLSSLKHVTYGAAPIAGKLVAAVKERLNLELLQQVYGMTEMGVTHVTPQEVFKPESIGVVLANNLCKILDVETGSALGPNTPGELVVQGPQVIYAVNS